jgi:hypothetical protein
MLLPFSDQRGGKFGGCSHGVVMIAVFSFTCQKEV